MQIIKLPRQEFDQMNLGEINQQLQDGKVQLDWNLVEEVSDRHLEILLQGLSIAAHEKVLGTETISPRLCDRINRVIDKLSSGKSSEKNKPRIQGKLLEEQFIPATSQPQDGQGELLRTEFVVPLQNVEQEKILQKATPREIREKLVTMIYKDLLGPVNGEHEEVDEDRVSLTERYLVGVIAPRKRYTKVTSSDELGDKIGDEIDITQEEDPAQQDNLAIAGKKNSDDGDTEEVAPPSSLFPSSIGLSFCVDGDFEEIDIHASWGYYQKRESEVITNDKNNPKIVWKRRTIKGDRLFKLADIAATAEQTREWLPDPENAPAVVLRVRCRKIEHDWIVTIFLENCQTEPARNRDSAWLFQPEIKVRGRNPHQAIFIRKPLSSSDSLDGDLRYEQESLQLLYRNCIEFAVGHNTSVHAEVVNDAASKQNDRAISLTTSAIPRHIVPNTTPPDEREIPALKGLILDMKVLAQVEAEALPPILDPLVNAYEQWLQVQQINKEQLPNSPSFYKQAADRNLKDCQEALKRIRAGIEILATNPQAVEAFQFMNAAMAQQRIHGLYAEQKRQGKEKTLSDFEKPENYSWRTFQLAFILINLPSLTDLHHPDRQTDQKAICDLLWFPTGGGKTEAYLGLTAYTLAMRRLQGVVSGHDGEHGVAVLMRYTLRLLTLQQFQRATTLICACESLRRKDVTKWGREPFRIGLWVGNNSTPNRTEQSEETIKQLKGQHQGQNYSSSSGTPHQLTNCPWCGSVIDAGKDIEVLSFEKNIGRTLVYCSDRLGNCLFGRRHSPNEGLPIVVVDEEIYRRLPSLVIATVDKFAQMPWNGKIQMLFGKVNGYCDRHGFRCPDLEDNDSHPKKGNLPAAKTRPHLPLRPPDLIIQDELHLISGALGSMVGLYETAIDRLCTWDVNGQQVRPKVIASTATIRQARHQVHQLFLREVKIFPPQAIDIEDNFFSRQRPPSNEHSGRLYLGICAPGRRLKAALIRVYLVALSAAQQLMNDGYDADPWMTLVGYFNSLRELGGTRRLVDDDITTRLSKMEARGLAKRYLNKIEELTSRKSSTDIPTILDALEIKFTGAKDKKQQKPLDLILATNMISVGVDVKRLGLMVACGQPKNTAEYIQATSRVGRSHPGLVLTVYNWARPRDLSHYERFEHYHATFYQHVEPLSVTPFSSGALDRGLAALFISLVRLSGFEFNDDDGAARMIAENFEHPDLISSMEAIADRISQSFQNPDLKDGILYQLYGLRDKWARAARPNEAGTRLQFKASSRGDTTVSLLKNIAQDPDDYFACLNSLRNVEPAAPLIFVDKAPDNESDRLPEPFVS